MSFAATITAVPAADDPPLWESFGHLSIDDAYRSAETYVHAAQPGDRLQADHVSESMTHVWGIFNPAGIRVADLFVAAEDN